MKGILIDPFDKTVTEVVYTGDYRNIYHHIAASTFDSVRIAETEMIFVDDNGLFVPDQRFFVWDGYPQPLAGKGLILGLDAEGNSVATKMTVEEVKSRVDFPDGIEFERIEVVNDEVDHPILGRVSRVSNIPVFRVKGG